MGEPLDGLRVTVASRSDTDETRRAVTLSKLAKFQQLRGIPLPAEPGLVTRFGSINNDNDRSDVRFLAALDAKAVDFVVSQDIGLHRRAERAGLSANVFTSREEALELLRRGRRQRLAKVRWCWSRVSRVSANLV